MSGAGYPAGEGRLRIILPACGCALLRLKEAEVSHERRIKQNKFLLLGFWRPWLAALALSVLLPSGVEVVSFEYTAR